MALRDYLLPGEQVRFQGSKVKQADGHYRIVLTERRILLYDTKSGVLEWSDNLSRSRKSRKVRR